MRANVESTTKTGYAVAHGWEHASVISKEQITLLVLLNTSANRCISSYKFKNREESGKDLSLEDSPSSSQRDLLFESLVTIVQNVQKFHAWYSTTDAILSREVDERFRSYASHLNKLYKSCILILEKIAMGQQNLCLLRSIYNNIESRGETLRYDCQRLMREKEKLEEYADVLSSKLIFFEEIEQVTSSLAESSLLHNSASIEESSLADFVGLLEHMDSCLDFIDDHQQYASGKGYGLKLYQLRGRALASIRLRFVSLLHDIKISLTRSVVMNRKDHKEKEKDPQGTEQKNILADRTELVVPDELVTSTFYIKYSTFASELKSLILAIEKRSEKFEYQLLIQDFHNLYCEERSRLLMGTVRRKINEVISNSTTDIQSLARAGISYLTEISLAERRLFRLLFTVIEPHEALVPLMNSLGGLFNDVLRPMYITLGKFYSSLF